MKSMLIYKGYTIEVIRGQKSSYAVATHLTNGKIISGDVKITPKDAVNNVKDKINFETAKEIVR